MNNDSVFFVMPAYNEAANIEETIRQWYPVVERCNAICGNSRIVIANDGSKDNTFAIMQKLKDSFPLLDPIDKTNSGHGATLLMLYNYAIKNGATYVFQTDSDGQTSPEEFWQMFDNKEKYDFQIGSRQSREDGFARICVTKILRLVVWLIFHVWVVDANTPFRLMNSQKLSDILKVIPQDFFLSNVAISAIATKWNYNIGWYKITFRPRQGGVNSINLRRIIKIGWKALGEFRDINNKVKHGTSLHE